MNVSKCSSLDSCLGDAKEALVYFVFLFPLKNGVVGRTLMLDPRLSPGLFCMNCIPSPNVPHFAVSDNWANPFLPLTIIRRFENLNVLFARLYRLLMHEVQRASLATEEEIPSDLSVTITRGDFCRRKGMPYCNGRSGNLK